MTGDPHAGGTEAGFIGGVEASVFAAVMLTLLAVIVETFGVLIARDTLLSHAQFAAAQIADGYAPADATSFHSAQVDTVTFTVATSVDACPQVRVAATQVVTGTVTTRQYELSATVFRPLTLYRDFTVHPDGGQATC